MVDFLNTVDNVLYYPILIVVLAAAGIYFSIRTRFVQVRLFVEAIRTLAEKPQETGGVSSLEALFVSTASRVGTGIYRDLLGRAGGCVLDVGACDYRCVFCVCRKYACAGL